MGSSARAADAARAVSLFCAAGVADCALGLLTLHTAHDAAVCSLLRPLVLAAACAAAAGAWRQLVQPRVAGAGSNLGSHLGVPLVDVGTESNLGLPLVDVGTGGALRLDEEGLAQERAKAAAFQRGERRRDVLLWVGFTAATASGFFAGLRCVELGTGMSGTGEAALVGAGVFLAHLEFMLGRRAVLKFTEPEGIKITSLHAHRLVFEPQAVNRVCQLCRDRIAARNHQKAAYYCPKCEYHYYCINCLKRHVRQH